MEIGIRRWFTITLRLCWHKWDAQGEFEGPEYGSIVYRKCCSRCWVPHR